MGVALTSLLSVGEEMLRWRRKSKRFMANSTLPLLAITANSRLPKTAISRPIEEASVCEV